MCSSHHKGGAESEQKEGEEQFEEEPVEEAEPEESPEAEAADVGHGQTKTVSLAANNEDAVKNLSAEVAATFLYKPLVPLPNLSQYVQSIIKVIVASEYLCKSNKAYRQRHCWGSDIYTSDSDVVCILQHCGLLKILDESPKDMAGVAVYFRVTKGRNSYQSTLRNGIRSKKQGQFDVSPAS